MERSRTGCATCRKRKRKCDETRPACRACTARGVECGGYNLELRWGNAVASRGHLAGATTPVRPPANSSSSSSSIRASSASRRPPSYEHTFSHSPQSSLSSSSPSTSPAGAQYSLSPPEEDSSSGGVVVVAQDVEPQVGPLYERCQSMQPCQFLPRPFPPCHWCSPSSQFCWSIHHGAGHDRWRSGTDRPGHLQFSSMDFAISTPLALSSPSRACSAGWPSTRSL